MALTINYSFVSSSQITFSDAAFNGSVLGLQDALMSSGANYYGPTSEWPFIFPGTCPEKDDRPNCTAACLGPGILFANLTILTTAWYTH